MTQWSITGGRLTAAQATGVLALAEAAETADGVAPLSEHTLLHLRYDDREPGPGPARERYPEPASEHGTFEPVRAARERYPGPASEYGPSGPYERSVPGHGEDRRRSLDNASIEGAGAGQAGGNRDGDLNNANFRMKHRDLVLAVSDQIAGYAHLDSDALSMDLSGELVIHPGHRGRGLGLALVRELTAEADGHPVRLWAHGDLPAANRLARAAGFDRFRALWQMRRSLRDLLEAPRFPVGSTLRTFRPGRDENEWLSLNGRAFARHPEQGAWTRHDLELREREPWFDPAGFFIAERNGAMAGFHWTKIHGPAAGPDSVGEVYVVGVDPGERGTGLGRALTVAGLRYLRDHGLAQAMLYVDEDNVPAIRMYQALGFTRTRTDAMYRQAVLRRGTVSPGGRFPGSPATGGTHPPDPPWRPSPDPPWRPLPDPWPDPLGPDGPQTPRPQACWPLGGVSC